MSGKLLLRHILLLISTLGIVSLSGSYTKSDNLSLCTESKEHIEWRKNIDKSAFDEPFYCDQEDLYLPTTDVTTILKALPSSYKSTYTTAVRNQQSVGSCWAFSASTVVETLYKKKTGVETQFSSRHMDYMSTRSAFLNGQTNPKGYNRTVGSGGYSRMSAHYYNNNYGPVLESKMPFENNTSLIDINKLNQTVFFDVNDIELIDGTPKTACSSDVLTKIKTAIQNYGAVGGSIYYVTKTPYYNSSTHALYSNSTALATNHAITIVGWDDTYSKNNFYTKPSRDGAFIIQNSHGTSANNKGFFYISYDDINICSTLISVKSYDTRVEDNTYTSSLLGTNGNFGGSSNTMYEKQIFSHTSGKNETLTELGFATPSAGNYVIYYYPGSGPNTEISNMSQIASGTMDSLGYKSVSLSTPIVIPSSITKFTIVIKLVSNTTNRPIPVSIQNTDMYKYLSVPSGVSFYSTNGTSWSDFATKGAVPVISAFTNNDVTKQVTLKSASYSNSTTKTTITVNTNITGYTTSDLSVGVKNPSGTQISLSKVTTSSTSNGVISKITITLPKITEDGTYTIMVTAGGSGKSITLKMSKGSITSTTYRVDQSTKYIYPQPNTSISTFTSKLSGSTGKVYSSSTQVTSGVVKTGMTIDGYTIAVLGDVTGDGYAKMNDIMMISAQIVNGSGITTTAGKKAADVNADGLIKMNDIMKISNYIVNGGSL